LRSKSLSKTPEQDIFRVCKRMCVWYQMNSAGLAILDELRHCYFPTQTSFTA